MNSGNISDIHKTLRPCLVLGTGFHRWVLGASMIRGFDPLIDWNELLLAVACKMNVPLERSTQSLTLHWEHLLQLALHEKGCKQSVRGCARSFTVSNVELLAKQVACGVLKGLQAAYPDESSRANFPLDDAWGAVVSLNFDAFWLGAKQNRWQEVASAAADVLPVHADQRVLSAELTRLNRHIILPSAQACTNVRRLWFPNGYLNQPRSLRLGLREFGFQPVAVFHAVNALKAFENQSGSYAQRRGFVQAALEGAPTLESFFDNHSKLPLTWVTEIMYRPVCFAGVGMSVAEAGLWWLMVQRSRNLANVHKQHHPPAAILVRDDDQHLALWRTNPCNIEPIVCSSWEEGWQKVKAWGDACKIQSIL